MLISLVPNNVVTSKVMRDIICKCGSHTSTVMLLSETMLPDNSRYMGMSVSRVINIINDSISNVLLKELDLYDLYDNDILIVADKVTAGSANVKNNFMALRQLEVDFEMESGHKAIVVAFCDDLPDMEKSTSQEFMLKHSTDILRFSDIVLSEKNIEVIKSRMECC